MDNFWGSFRSYLLAAVFALTGLGVFLYITLVPHEEDNNIVDISPSTGYDWNDITDGMHVKLEVNNIMGYYDTVHENGNDSKRIYLVYDYNRETRKYSRAIAVWVDVKDFDKWDYFFDKNLNDPDVKTFTITNYARKMSTAQFVDCRNTILSWGRMEIDDIEKMIVPYIIAEPEETFFDKYGKIGSIIVLGIGVLLLA